MTDSMIAAGVWVIVSAIIAFLPWQIHWRAASFLLLPTIVFIIPWLFYENGPVIGGLFLIGFCSILRWPLYYFGKFLIRKSKELIGR